MLADAMNRNHSYVSVLARHFCIHREGPLALLFDLPVPFVTTPILDEIRTAIPIPNRG
jgi:hypothetical protein